jgi:hypothetical protein
VAATDLGYDLLVDPRLRQVTRLTLSELWNDNGPVQAERVREVGVGDIRELLRLGASGVVANLGDRLRWLRGVELFEWWTDEARPRLVAPGVEKFRLEDSPGDRCWTASEWRLADGSNAILFESWH